MPRYKDILIIECSSSDLQDISPNTAVKDSHLKDYDKFFILKLPSRPTYGVLPYNRSN